MTGHLTRQVTASYTTPDGFKVIETVPAGTLVHVTRVHDARGTCEIRKPGTLLTQRIHLADVTPA
jgi:hypothetical protein